MTGLRAGAGRCALLLIALLAGCGGSGGPAETLPPGAEVNVPGFETYTTDHNGFARVRRDESRPEDAAILAGFDDDDPTDPVGYRNLIALNQALYGGRVSLEVLAQVTDTDSGEQVARLLRLTADTEPFRNEQDGRLATASGQFHLRGHNFTWVSIDDGPILSGEDDRGLVDLVLDFDTGRADLTLRTGVDGRSRVRSQVEARDLPFNIRTGAYGGGMQVTVWDPDGPDVLEITGVLRGNVGGTPTHQGGQHGLSTAGLYAAEGVDEATGRRLRLHGAFAGVDPNALP